MSDPQSQSFVPLDQGAPGGEQPYTPRRSGHPSAPPATTAGRRRWDNPVNAMIRPTPPIPTAPAAAVATGSGDRPYSEKQRMKFTLLWCLWVSILAIVSWVMFEQGFLRIPTASAILAMAGAWYAHQIWTWRATSLSAHRIPNPWKKH